jgi:hypothetical protein
MQGYLARRKSIRYAFFTRYAYYVIDLKHIVCLEERSKILQSLVVKK